MKLLSLMGCGVLLVGLAGPCLASGDQATASVPDILQAQHALRVNLDTPDGPYARFDKDSVHRIEAAQDQVFHLLDGVASLDQLNDQQKVALANALESIRATLTAQEDSRVICHVERKTGTHLTSRRCESVADRERNAAEARKFTGDHPDHIQQPQGH
jgi:hypothetical protein